MNRRSVIRQLAVGCTAVSVGCSEFVRQSEHQLWLLRIMNRSSQSISLSISISRSGEKIFNQTYSDIVSSRETEQDSSADADSPDIRLIKREWSPERGDYTLEYSFRGEKERLDVADMGDFETDHLGLEIIFLGGAMVPLEPTFNLIEFESEKNAREAVANIR